MYKALTLFLFTAVAASFTACESSVDPLIGEERPFTIWGLMNANADTQKVRVFAIDDEPGFDRSETIDAVVVSTDLTSGESIEWSHRAVTYDNGDVGHVFWAPFRAQLGHRYRLDVQRSDGESASATVTVPSDIDITIERSETSARVTATIRGDVPNLLDVAMRYEATNLPPHYAWPEGRNVHPLVFFPVEVSHQDDGTPIDGGWFYSIDMREDFAFVRDAYRDNCLITGGAPDIALRRVEFHFLAADAAWDPPTGSFDPDLLVEPGSFSNVKNGFGFFGAGVIVSERWTPSLAVRNLIGYGTNRACPDGPAPQPACIDPPIPCFDDDEGDVWSGYF